VPIRNCPQIDRLTRARARLIIRLGRVLAQLPIRGSRELPARRPPLRFVGESHDVPDCLSIELPTGRDLFVGLEGEDWIGVADLCGDPLRGVVRRSPRRSPKFGVASARDRWQRSQTLFARSASAGAPLLRAPASMCGDYGRAAQMGEPGVGVRRHGEVRPELRTKPQPQPVGKADAPSRRAGRLRDTCRKRCELLETPNATR
jgi:hypothetical protein